MPRCIHPHGSGATLRLTAFSHLVLFQRSSDFHAPISILFSSPSPLQSRRVPAVPASTNSTLEREGAVRGNTTGFSGAEGQHTGQCRLLAMRGTSLVRNILHSPKRRLNDSGQPCEEALRAHQGSIRGHREPVQPALAAPAHAHDRAPTDAATDTASNASPRYSSAGSEALQRWRARHGILREEGGEGILEKASTETSSPLTSTVGALELLPTPPPQTPSAAWPEGGHEPASASQGFGLLFASPDQSRVSSSSPSPLAGRHGAAAASRHSASYEGASAGELHRSCCLT